MKQQERNGVQLVSLALSSLALVVATLAVGCTEATRAVVVNGMTSGMSVLDIALPPRVTDHFGDIVLGTSANRVVVQGGEAFVVNSGTFGSAQNASIQVIDIETASLLRTIPLPDGDSPWTLAFVDDQKAYVTNLYTDSVTILDPQEDGPSAILGRIELPSGTAPEGIVVHEGRAFTANTGLDFNTFVYGAGSVSVIDAASDTVVDADGDPTNGVDTPVYLTGTNPQDLEMDAEGDLWIICTGDWFSVFGELDVVDTATLSFEDSLDIGSSPGSIAVGSEVALIGDGASASLFAVDIGNRTVIHDAGNPVVLSNTPWSFVPDIAFDRLGQVAYALAFSDDKIFEVLVVNQRVKLRSQYALEPGSGPGGIGLVYED